MIKLFTIDSGWFFFQCDHFEKAIGVKDVKIVPVSCNIVCWIKLLIYKSEKSVMQTKYTLNFN